MDIITRAAAFRSIYVIITIKICRKSFLAPCLERMHSRSAVAGEMPFPYGASVTFLNHFHLVASGMEKLLGQGKPFRPFNHFSRVEIKGSSWDVTGYANVSSRQRGDAIFPSPISACVAASCLLNRWELC